MAKAGKKDGTGSRRAAERLYGVALVAFGQGAGRIGVADESIDLLRDAYFEAIAERGVRLGPRRPELLTAARDLGQLAGGFARHDSSLEITPRHVRRAIAVIDGEMVPCPICDPGVPPRRP